MLEIPQLKNKDKLKEFLEQCEQTVEKTGNILNERVPYSEITSAKSSILP